MSSVLAPSRNTRARALMSRVAPWLPLVLIVGLTLGSWASGRAPHVPTASATTVDLTGTVNADLFLDLSQCTAPSLAIGDLVAGTDGFKTAQDQSSAVCSIGFGSTNDPRGTELSMFEDPSAPASPAAAMKCVSAGCTGSAISDFDGAGEPAAGTSAFGVQLLSTAGVATGSWSTAPAVHDVQDTGDVACETSTQGTGTCRFTVGATASAANLSGAYQASAQALVLAQ